MLLFWLSQRQCR